MWELTIVLWIGILYIGAAIGSFLNVVVYRIPHGLSLIYPGSHCPKCKTPLGPTENVPILGWLWLRGRCRHCGVSIPWRYPAVETGTMLTFALCFGVLGLTPQALGMALLCSWLIALALIDLDTFLLPEALTQSGLLVGLGFQMLLPWLMGQGSLATSAQALISSMVGAVVGIWLIESIGAIALVALGKPAMGLGDGKLMAMMGVWIGWQGILVTLILASVVGLVVSLFRMMSQQVQWGRPIPFGPYLAIGGAVAGLVGSNLIQVYLSWFGLTD